ncbi:hypothetical protein C8J57DRAFT_1511004 [Mycena rebaudengoi]|nr:hypothetical protein C8J57DRAFT_1511004 [Mycena rebaudengoi]
MDSNTVPESFSVEESYFIQRRFTTSPTRPLHAAHCLFDKHPPASAASVPFATGASTGVSDPIYAFLFHFTFIVLRILFPPTFLMPVPFRFIHFLSLSLSFSRTPRGKSRRPSVTMPKGIERVVPKRLRPPMCSPSTTNAAVANKAANSQLALCRRLNRRQWPVKTTVYALWSVFLTLCSLCSLSDSGSSSRLSIPLYVFTAICG